MIWEFGELGYDFSINRCTDGTVNSNCRLDKKPIRWDYKNVPERQRVFDIYAALNKLRFHGWYKDVFTANNISIARNMGSAVKSLLVRSATDSSDLFIIGNFDVNVQTASFSLPVAGTWHNYLRGGTITATGGPQTLNLQPGEYHVFLNRGLTNPVGPIAPVVMPGALEAKVYPNPAIDEAELEMLIPQSGMVEIWLMDGTGRKVKEIQKATLTQGKHTITLDDKINNLPAGIYYLQVKTGNETLPVKIILQ
jgi:hypothetical protein